MNKKGVTQKTIFFTIVLVSLIQWNLKAQKDMFPLFRTSITELHAEYQPKRAGLLKQYEASQKKMDEYAKEEPGLIILGGMEADSQKIKEAGDKIIEDINTSFRKIAVEDSIRNAEEKRKNPRPHFTSDPMFPNETLGKQLYPDGLEPARVDTGQWVVVDGGTFVEEIAIEDIADPKEKARLTDISEYSNLAFEINKIDFIAALEKEITDDKKFSELELDLEKKGYDLQSAFMNIRLLGESQKKKAMRDAILELINDILD
jgi:hypothetical protein